MQDLCPTRARILMTIYDFQRTDYRTMPGAYVKVVIANPAEGKRLLRMIRKVVDGGEWQDSRHRAATVKTDGESVVPENDDVGTVGANIAAG